MFASAHMHTHTSYPLKRHNLQNRPAALVSKGRAECGTQAEPGMGALGARAHEAPLAHCHWYGPSPRTAWAGLTTGRDGRLAAMPTQGPNQATRSGRNPFLDNPGWRTLRCHLGPLFLKILINAAIEEPLSSLWTSCISTTWDVKHRFLGSVTETPIPTRPGKGM